MSLNKLKSNTGVTIVFGRMLGNIGKGIFITIKRFLEILSGISQEKYMTSIRIFEQNKTSIVKETCLKI